MQHTTGFISYNVFSWQIPCLKFQSEHLCEVSCNPLYLVYAPEHQALTHKQQPLLIIPHGTQSPEHHRKHSKIQLCLKDNLAVEQ